uniref:Beta-lactamase-related domain-containing protein n=1 Tax=Ditylenchus dipsaci TaxID=166011 RepID=A0A915CRB3_9BILA
MCQRKYLQRMVKGNVSLKFEPIKQSFSRLLENEEGLTLAVYHKDELVVDLWGGYADKSSYRLWKEDTMSCGYSSTKVFGSLVVASLVSQGRLAYTDLVIKHWPEFGKHGKDILTVEDLVNHKAGLIAFSAGKFTIEEAKDLDLVSKIIEDSKPWESAIKKFVYHAATIGFVLDQLVRRVDMKKRTISQFYLEEVQPNIQYGEQFYIGLPKKSFIWLLILLFQLQWKRYSMLSEIQCRCSDLPFQNWDPKFKEIMNLYSNSVKFLAVTGIYNDPDVLSVQSCASTGVGTARGIAQAAQYFFKSKLITEEVQEVFKHPTEKIYLPNPLEKEEFSIMQMVMVDSSVALI